MFLQDPNETALANSHTHLGVGSQGRDCQGFHDP